MSAPAPRRSPAFAIIFGFLVLAGVLGALVGFYNLRRAPVVRILRRAELAPLPASAREVLVTDDCSGSGCTAALHFEAPPEELALWVKTSPGLHGVEPQAQGQGRAYLVHPGTRFPVQVTVDDARVEVVSSYTPGD